MHAGLMQKSKIGEGNVESGAVSVNERRTSSTVLLDSTVVEQHPQLQPMVLQLQSKAQKLLDIGMLGYVSGRKKYKPASGALVKGCSLSQHSVLRNLALNLMPT